MNELNQNLKTEQQTISQQMIQSAEILQMDCDELEAYVENLMLENPLVELLEKNDRYELRKEVQRRTNSEDNEDLKDLDKWNFSMKEKSLHEYVKSQLISEIQSPKDKKIIEYLICCLNEKGYLEIEEDDIYKHLDIEQKDYENYVKILQTAEPTGIGARDLRECLLLQLDKRSQGNLKQKEHDNARRIVSECLEELSKNLLKQISIKLNMTIDDVNSGIHIIRELNPKPGNGFYVRENLKYIHPEVIVVKFKDYFEVILSENFQREIVINNYYASMLNEDCEKETKLYIGEKKRQAEWVGKCIQQRNKTLLRVAKVIVEQQRIFFEKGQGFLKPLRMIDVAELLDIHEATVSRAVKNKYLQCYQGVYPLNYFFAKQFGAGDNVPEDMKAIIKEIISNENKREPLSDQKIETMMLNKGLRISRRTVAKYRQELGIKNAEGRREYI